MERVEWEDLGFKEGLGENVENAGREELGNKPKAKAGHEYRVPPERLPSK